MAADALAPCNNALQPAAYNKQRKWAIAFQEEGFSTTGVISVWINDKTAQIYFHVC